MSKGNLIDVLEPWRKVYDILKGENNVHESYIPLQAPDPTAYEVFNNLFMPHIERFHGYKISEK